MNATKPRTEEQKFRRRQQQSHRRKLALDRFVAEAFSRKEDNQRQREPENLQQTWKPRTVNGRTLCEEDEFLDRLRQFGHEYAKDD